MLITTHTQLRVKEVPHLTWVKYRSIAPKTTSLCNVTQLYIIQLQHYSGELLRRGGGGVGRLRGSHGFQGEKRGNQVSPTEYKEENIEKVTAN